MMESDTDLLVEIRDLLRIIAEPQMAERDRKLRAELAAVVGKGEKQQKAVLKMDGTRSQTQIAAECGIDPGQLSRLSKTLEGKGLIDKKSTRLRLTIPVPANFFEKGGA